MASKKIVWLKGEVKTPPFSLKARREAGFLLRKLQKGYQLEMPHSKAMPTIGKNCYELRIQDKNISWRIIYMLEVDAIVIGQVFKKKTQKTPTEVIEKAKRIFKEYKKTTK